MITKKLFSAQSPIWQLLLAITGILIVTTVYALYINGDPSYAILEYGQTPTGETMQVSLNPQLALALIIGTPTIVAYSIVCYRYNKKNNTKLRLFSLKPHEIMSDDERLLQASATAALKLYSQNHLLFPVMALILIFAVSSGLVVLTGTLIAFMSIYYATYLKAMWPYLGDM